MRKALQLSSSRMGLESGLLISTLEVFFLLTLLSPRYGSHVRVLGLSHPRNLLHRGLLLRQSKAFLLLMGGLFNPPMPTVSLSLSIPFLRKISRGLQWPRDGQPGSLPSSKSRDSGHISWHLGTLTLFSREVSVWGEGSGIQ